MKITDIDKLIPALDRTTLTAGEHDFAAAQIVLLRKTLAAQYYGVVAGYDDFWRERDDCPLEGKFTAMGASLQLFFASHIVSAAALNQLATIANNFLPPEQAIELLDMSAPGTIEFNPDGSFLAWTPATEPES
jgi:hypothetical protein